MDEAGNREFPADPGDRRPRVFGYTLGCRLNACETDAMVDAVVRELEGSRAVDHLRADIVIVNTCTVTGRSDARCRKAVKGFRAANPEALLVVAGCASQMRPEDYRGIPGCLVVGNPGKENLPDLIRGLPSAEREEGLFPSRVSAGRRTRAFLKIQSGCDHRCSYCIVPLARGPSRSQPRDAVLRQARELMKLGKREICLVGVDLADYGRGIHDDYRLADLVGDLLRIGGFRVRLSSLEPRFLTVSALRRLAALPGLCRHFHLPMQSGSDRVLSAMGRGYRRSHQEKLLETIHSLFPGAAVGADFIAGFPEETDADHGETVSLARSGLLAYLHVFPFSPRPGTPAASMKRLHTEVVTGRSRELREVSHAIRRNYRESLLGTDGLALVEGRRHEGRMVGLTDNYVPVAVPEDSREGELVRVVLSRENVCWRLR
jgi:threonylcarbamoyladenosine tRNA methylthiotransferase MtaB